MEKVAQNSNLSGILLKLFSKAKLKDHYLVIFKILSSKMFYFKNRIYIYFLLISTKPAYSSSGIKPALQLRDTTDADCCLDK